MDGFEATGQPEHQAKAKTAMATAAQSTDASISRDAEALLAQIEQACRQFKIAQSTFGRLAVNDGKLVTRLQQGGRVTLSTVERVHNFIEQQGGLPIASLRSAIRGLDVDRPAPDFRFYDNRQKYLMFVNTTSEKQAIAKRALDEIAKSRPQPPAIRIMDAGAGDGSALGVVLRGMHTRHPTAPFYVVAKEFGMDNVRLILSRMADRLQEHPQTVLVLTNLKYKESLRLKPHDPAQASRMIWREVALDGDTAGEFEQQIAGLDPWINDHWRVAQDGADGLRSYHEPAVLVLYRRDHRFALDPVLPRRGLARGDFDFILASHPYRARSSLDFKAGQVIAPLVRGLRPNGRLLGIQGFGRDPGMEIVQGIWPEEQPFIHGRDALYAAIGAQLGAEAQDFEFEGLTDREAVFRYHVRLLPDEIDPARPTSSSTLLAAWNAATYAAQIEDTRLGEALVGDLYGQATRETLLRHKGLWFNDEAFVIARRSALG